MDTVVTMVVRLLAQTGQQGTQESDTPPATIHLKFCPVQQGFHPVFRNPGAFESLREVET
jgi:hypothetical protein